MSKERITLPSPVKKPNQLNELGSPPSPPSPSQEVILQVSLSDKVVNEPMEIEVSQTIFERMTKALEKRSLEPKFVAAGAVIFVAAATTAGIVVAKKAIERGKKEGEVRKAHVPILNEEQQRQFKEMYLLSYPLVYSYIRKRLEGVPVQDIEDLTQQVFLRACLHFPPGHIYPDISNPYSPWLYRIAHNLLVNRYRDRERAKKREAGSIEDEEIFPRPKGRSVFELVVSEQEAAELQRTIASLQHPYPLVLWLKSALHLSNKEIAEILGKTEGAIKSIYIRALRNLRKILSASKDQGDGP